MKKLVIAAALGLMSTGAFAQVDKVKSAEKLIDSNTAEARKQAAEARQNDATKNDPYAWFVRLNCSRKLMKTRCIML